MSESVLEVLEAGTHFLKGQGLRDARESSEKLLSYILKKTKTSLYLDSTEVVTGAKQKTFFELVKKRSDHHPLQYLVRYTPFRYIDLQITSGVFIPRPETECLVDVVLKRVSEAGGDRPEILDIGTGAGGLAISLAKEIPNATVVATDCSKQALAVAARNAVRNGVADRIQFVQTNYWQGISNRFDIVVSNPPYLSKRDLQKLQPEVRFEPKRALDGGQNGLRAYHCMVAKVEKVLKGGGLLVFEVGKGQASCVEALLGRNGFLNIWKTKDLLGVERVVSARLVR